MPKKNVGPKIEQSSVDFFQSTFQNVNQGCTYLLDSFPSLYLYTLRSELRGRFTSNELSLMIDALSTLALNPSLAGRHLALEVEDGLMLEKLWEKWNIENILDFVAQVRRLTIFQAHCLEVWCRAFWGQVDVGIEDWVSELATATTKAA